MVVSESGNKVSGILGSVDCKDLGDNQHSLCVSFPESKNYKSYFKVREKE